MSCDPHSTPAPILEMDGYQWDVSNLSSNTYLLRNDNCQSSLPDGGANRRNPVRTSICSFQPDQCPEEASFGHSSRTSELGANFINSVACHPSELLTRRADSAAEYEVVPTYPSLAEIPACLDVDDIFDKIRASKDALNSGKVVKQVQRLSPPTYLRTSRHCRRSNDPSSQMAPTSSSMDNHLAGGDRTRFGDASQGRGKSAPGSHFSRQKEQHLKPGSSQDRSVERSERSLVANATNQRRRRHRQDHLRAENDLPSKEAVVATIIGRPSSRDPEYHGPQQSNLDQDLRRYSSIPDNSPGYFMRDGDDFDQHHPHHYPKEVIHHREAGEGHESNFRGHVEPSSYSRRSSASVVSGISDDPSSDLEYPLSQKPSNFGEDRLVEVTPGMFVKLRGSVETWNAIQTGRTIRSACLSCTVILLCVVDADMVMCPSCRSISPVERGGFGGGGLGLGMSEDEAIFELDRLASQWRQRYLHGSNEIYEPCFQGKPKSHQYCQLIVSNNMTRQELFASHLEERPG
jgi:hypothetical protein